jgi:hypothetical protein
MFRYYVIREVAGRILAIHKTPDSAHMCFLNICSQESFRGNEIHLVVVTVDDSGRVLSETLSFMYIRGECVILDGGTQITTG